MVDRARFDIILKDGFSGPAGRAAGALRGVEKAMGRLQQRERAQARTQLNRYGRDLAGAAGRNALWRFRFTDIGLAGLASAGAEVVSTFGRIAYAASAAYLNVARFQEGSMVSLRTVLGNNEAASRTFQNALVMANQTPLDPTDVIGMFTNLAVAGFGERELAPLTAAAADIQAARGQAASDALVRVFAQMRGLGRVQRGDITMQAITAGLNAGDIFQSIARQMSLGSGAAGIRAAEQAVSRGRVNDRIAINAFLDSVQRRYDSGGALGTFARNQSSTLTGALSNMQGALGTLLMSGRRQLSESAGVKSVTAAVLALNSSLDMTSATGQRLRGVIVGAADAVLTGLFGSITEAGINGVMNDALDFADGFVAVLRFGLPIAREFVGGFITGFRAGIRPVLSALRAMGSVTGGEGFDAFTTAVGYAGTALGYLVGAIVVVGGGMAALTAGVGQFGAILVTSFAGLDSIATGLGDFGYNGAVAIVEGFERGIAETGGRIASSVTGAFDGAVGAARDVLDWHSPSGLFMQAGSDVARGFALGVQGGAGLVASSVAGLVTPGAAPAGAGAAGGRPAANIVISIDGAQDSRAIVRELMRELMGEFEVLELQGGAVEVPGG